MFFIETSFFTKLLPDYLSDDEYRGLQSYLLQKPDAGDIVKGSGGVRKVRWASSGKGKISLRNNELREPSAPQIIRSKLKMSQVMFAGLLGVSTRTLQDWEQGRRNPQGPALALLRIAEQHPEVFSELR